MLPNEDLLEGFQIIDQNILARRMIATLTESITTESLESGYCFGQAQGHVMSLMKHAGQVVRIVPNATDVSEAEKIRIAKVLGSERAELDQAIADNDITEIVDGICDEIYVLLSVACTYGIYLAPFIKEVCNNNFFKTLYPKVVDDSGKLLKPRDHKSPRIAEMLQFILNESKSAVPEEIASKCLQCTQPIYDTTYGEFCSYECGQHWDARHVK